MSCWISVGSNLRREASIAGGLRELRQRFGTLRLSPIYETQAIGTTGPPFFNLVVGIQTQLTVSALNAILNAIEDAQGRERSEDKFAPRTLDLDLLTYGQMIGPIEGYQVPREDILDYAFVLAPLAAVAPEECHPQLGLSYATLWQAFDLDARGQPAPVLVSVALD
ncbi:2-amino-4-hydroxy-6-hydroxymethyldihydropteridine diphosphokinase [Rhabdochromatium marinum]|nr:2-amino-4-hydroxy-6-hydroxymethyldihydropteridine diphosphokinase [Rhabdochromatium marinum]